MSGNLFEIRKDWPIPHANDTVTATIPKPHIKIKPQVPSTTVSRPEWCGWGENCPICKNVVDENWDDNNLQDQSQQANKKHSDKDTPQMNLVQNKKQTLAQNIQHSQNHQECRILSPPRYSSMLQTSTWNKPIFKKKSERRKWRD